jgi:hypothetical protein
LGFRISHRLSGGGTTTHPVFFYRSKGRYADDLLMLCKPGQGPGLQTRRKRWLEARKLKLNEEKTRLVCDCLDLVDTDIRITP